VVVYYGRGMHDFIVREIEVGTRVALAEDMEWLGFGVWVGLSLIEHLEAERVTTETGCRDSPYPPSEATR
jgi:hypothetical protein